MEGDVIPICSKVERRIGMVLIDVGGPSETFHMDGNGHPSATFYLLFFFN